MLIVRYVLIEQMIIIQAFNIDDDDDDDDDNVTIIIQTLNLFINSNIF